MLSIPHLLRHGRRGFDDLHPICPVRSTIASLAISCGRRCRLLRRKIGIGIVTFIRCKKIESSLGIKNTGKSRSDSPRHLSHQMLQRSLCHRFPRRCSRPSPLHPQKFCSLPSKRWGRTPLKIFLSDVRHCSHFLCGTRESFGAVGL